MASNKYEYILRYGNHQYNEEDMNMFVATDAAPGSPEKIEIMRRRLELGHPIFHENDRSDYGGLGLFLKNIENEDYE
jgi:hypothetical protein